jgi:serine/threonine protein phosphatase PrpC
MLVLSGEIQEKDIRGHEDRNRLIRVMGMEWNTPKYEIGGAARLGANETYLLCSDGFWEWITEKEMSRLLKTSATPKEWIEKMCEKVTEAGRGANMDNYSAIAVYIR